jgi:ribA/ribD-fused uncharacterized protein
MSEAQNPKSSKPLKYIFFWSADGANGIYSQWHKSQFKENGKTFMYAETYMMYHKALLFNDEKTATRILISKSPAQIKMLGQLVKNFDEEKWDAVKKNIVINANYLKFTQNENLKTAILRTDPESKFVEASPYDRIWGIGFNERDALCNKANWGQNLLGDALNEVRKRILNLKL